MRRALMGTTMRGGATAAHVAVLLACCLLAACASGGKDRSFDLPAGEEFDATASNRVLVVTEAHNECGDVGNCVPTAPGPCHLGDGNSRGLVVYRLGTTGLLVGNPVDGAVPEQVIATDDNPRRIVAHPTDQSLVYVATKKRVQVIRLRSGGGSACIAETLTDQDVTSGADDMDPVDLTIDPSVGNGVLYVAGRGSNRVDAYPIADDGTIQQLPTSCIVGGSNSEFTAIATMSGNFFVAGGSNHIEVHARVDGEFLAQPDPNATATPTPAPSATPAPDSTPGPTEPSPQRSTCFDARLVSTPLSSIGGAIVNQMVFDPSSSAPLGQLFLAEEVSQRIFTFPVNADGVISENDSSSTKRAGVYQRMLRVDQSPSSVLYSSVFNEGRVDAFRLESGLLPNESFSRTAEDPKTLPVALALDPTRSVLYVAEGGIDRVDGFRIQPDGGLPDEPATSTAPRVDATGNDFSTFPDDIVIVTLP